VFNLFGVGTNWMRTRQSIVSLSTIEAEYMVTTHVSKEDVWLQYCVQVLGLYNKL
jgi:hypothetical protein